MTPEFGWFVGIDWATVHHQLCVVDRDDRWGYVVTCIVDLDGERWARSIGYGPDAAAQTVGWGRVPDEGAP